MKCLPAMFYGVEVCPLKKSQTESLQFAVNGSFMKIFNTKSVNHHHHHHDAKTAEVRCDDSP